MKNNMRLFGLSLCVSLQIAAEILGYVISIMLVYKVSHSEPAIEVIRWPAIIGACCLFLGVRILTDLLED